MKKPTKLIAIFLVLVTLVSLAAIPASAIGYSMSITIYYKNEAGQQVAPTLKTSCDAAASTKPSWTSPTVSGYVLKNSGDSVVTYDMLNKSFPASNYIRNGSGTYTVYYTDTVNKTVYYKYNYDRHITAADTVTKTGKIGNSYYITSPSITGYTPSADASRA